MWKCLIKIFISGKNKLVLCSDLFKIEVLNLLNRGIRNVDYIDY